MDTNPRATVFPQNWPRGNMLLQSLDAGTCLLLQIGNLREKVEHPPPTAFLGVVDNSKLPRSGRPRQASEATRKKMTKMVLGSYQRHAQLTKSTRNSDASTRGTRTLHHDQGPRLENPKQMLQETASDSAGFSTSAAKFSR